MENFRKDVESTLYLLDNKPIEDYDGLSRSEMRYLIHNPFTNNSLLEINTNISSRIISQIPYLKPILFLLKKASEVKYIKLSRSGYLPPDLVKKIGDTVTFLHGFLIISSGRLSAEQDSIGVRLSREIAENSGCLVRKKNKLFISPDCKEQLLTGNFSEIFRKVFIGFTQHYEWKRFHYSENPITGQKGFAYTLYLLSKYGKSFKPISFYVDKYVKAFPFTSEELMCTEIMHRPDPIPASPADFFPSSFETVTFRNFLVNFKLVDYQWVEKPNSDRRLMIKKSRTFNKIFNFKN